MGNKAEKLEFRCSSRLRALLELVAREQDMTLSEVIRAACEDYTYPHIAFKVPIAGTITQEGIKWNSEGRTP